METIRITTTGVAGKYTNAATTGYAATTNGYMSTGDTVVNTPYTIRTDGGTTGGNYWVITQPNYVNPSSIFNTWINYWLNTPIASKLPKELASGSFPPCDIYEDEDRNLIFDFCVAGYQEKDIELEFEEDRMYLYLGEIEEKKGIKFLQKGIKKSEVEADYYVPFEKYEVTKSKAKITNGILKVTVPMKEDEKPIKLKIDK